MKQRQLGKNGPKISEIGLGCWQLGADWGDPVSEEVGLAILQEAVSQGVTLFDTADVYGQGKSESLIGKFLTSEKKPLQVITKFGQGNGIYPDNYSEKALNESVEGSLNRLGQNTLDLLQLHCVPTELLLEGSIFKWLKNLKNNGLIKQFGASVESIEQGLICMEQEELLSLQVIFNIYRQRLINELFPTALDKGVGIIVRLPLASGLLAGVFDAKTTFSPADHRNYNKNGEAFNVGETFAGIPFEKGVEITNKLRELYVPKEMIMAQFALRWILDHEAVSCVIPGASKVQQVNSNAEASRLSPLSRDLHEQLHSFYKTEVEPFIRGPY